VHTVADQNNTASFIGVITAKRPHLPQNRQKQHNLQKLHLLSHVISQRQIVHQTINILHFETATYPNPSTNTTHKTSSGLSRVFTDISIQVDLEDAQIFDALYE
jgi:hypothetical protein